jgi:DNA-binding NarL/FixJ family response regulator
MADAVGCPAVRASALVNKGIALADTVDGHDEGIALLEQAIAETEAGDFGYVLHRALFNLLVHQVDVWPPERSRQVLWRMRETGERTGRGSEAPGWAMHHSEIAVIEGDLEAALAAVRDARGHELVPLEGWIDPLWVDLREASLLLERGHLDQAEALLERHPDPLEPRAVSCDVGWLWAQRLEVAARRGDLPAARVALDGYRSAAPWRGWRWKHSHLGLHGPIAAMRVGLPPAEVHPLVDTIDRDAPAGPDRRSPRRAARLHLEAAMLEAEGEPAAALEVYRQVLGHDEVYRAPYLLADCHQGAARCLLALGDQPAAADHARQAAALLDRWPGWHRDEAAALLRRLGHGPTPPGDPIPLTPREREVAALLAEGLSKGVIARRLYISTKTASVHVSNILAKLDMTSRTEVATWAMRSGLVPPA